MAKILAIEGLEGEEKATYCGSVVEVSDRYSWLSKNIVLLTLPKDILVRVIEERNLILRRNGEKSNLNFGQTVVLQSGKDTSLTVFERGERPINIRAVPDSYQSSSE